MVELSGNPHPDVEDFTGNPVDAPTELVRFENVGLRYGIGPEILRDLDFSINSHSFQFLTGPSGAGKTTLLKLILQTLKPTRGRVSLFGQSISGTEPISFLDVPLGECPGFHGG